MNDLNLEGKIYGYNKKTVALVALVVVVFGIAFYAGAMYEKKKLASLKSKGGSAITTGTSKKKSKKTKNSVPATTINGTTPAATGTDTTTDPNSTTPTDTTTQTTPSTTGTN
jgi:Flp pilus assembly protein TadG